MTLLTRRDPRRWGDPCFKRKLTLGSEISLSFPDFSLLLGLVGVVQSEPVRELTDGERQPCESGHGYNPSVRGEEGRLRVHVRVCVRDSGRL